MQGPGPQAPQRSGGITALGRDENALPALMQFQDRDNNRWGVHFIYQDRAAGPVHAILAWPPNGPTSGVAELMIGQPGQQIGSRSDVAYNAMGRFEVGKTDDGQSIALFRAQQENGGGFRPSAAFVILMRGNQPVLCAGTGSQDLACGLIPGSR